VVAVFGWRSWAQRRSTGDGGFRLRGGWGAAPRGPSALIAAGALTVVAGTVSVAGVERAAAGAQRSAAPIRCLGLAGLALGLAGTLRSQRDIGRSWRIGVDAAERTELVTTGLYGWVRNPVFSCMILAGLSSAWAVPGAATMLGAAAMAAGAELQARLVEEPHLRRAHGDLYLAYARRTGRFVPGVGRLTE
jgi:protein-S-isoprenylcysteine O-methyltransferase Ste14